MSMWNSSLRPTMQHLQPSWRLVHNQCGASWPTAKSKWVPSLHSAVLDALLLIICGAFTQNRKTVVKVGGTMLRIIIAKAGKGWQIVMNGNDCFWCKCSSPWSYVEFFVNFLFISVFNCPFVPNRRRKNTLKLWCATAWTPSRRGLMPLASLMR